MLSYSQVRNCKGVAKQPSADHLVAEAIVLLSLQRPWLFGVLVGQLW